VEAGFTTYRGLSGTSTRFSREVFRVFTPVFAQNRRDFWIHHGEDRWWMELITELKEAELEETFERSSGPGGQNVNKTSTKVTLRHIPTGILVTVQDTRSQFQNRALARERLLKTLNDRVREREQQAKAERELERRQKRKRPRRVKQAILKNKKRRGLIKRGRSGKDW